MYLFVCVRLKITSSIIATSVLDLAFQLIYLILTIEINKWHAIIAKLSSLILTQNYWQSNAPLVVNNDILCKLWIQLFFLDYCDVVKRKDVCLRNNWALASTAKKQSPTFFVNYIHNQSINQCIIVRLKNPRITSINLLDLLDLDYYIKSHFTT